MKKLVIGVLLLSLAISAFCAESDISLKVECDHNNLRAKTYKRDETYWALAVTGDYPHFFMGKEYICEDCGKVFCVQSMFEVIELDKEE